MTFQGKGKAAAVGWLQITPIGAKDAPQGCTWPEPTEVEEPHILGAQGPGWAIGVGPQAATLGTPRALLNGPSCLTF